MLDIFGRPVSWLKFSSSGLHFFFFSSTILLDQWLFGLLAFVFVARVHLFVHPLFSLYTSILATPYESVGGCYSIHVDKYSKYSLHPSTFVYVYYVSEATRMTGYGLD